MTEKKEIKAPVDDVTIDSHRYVAGCGLVLNIDIDHNTKNVIDIRVEKPDNPNSNAGKSGSCKGILWQIMSRMMEQLGHIDRKVLIQILTGVNRDLIGNKDAKMGSGYFCPVGSVGPGKRSCIDKVVKSLLDGKEYEEYIKKKEEHKEEDKKT